jgi:hypothetical protein
MAFGCKQGQETKELKTEQSVPNIITEVPVSPILKEFVKFVDLEILDSITVNQFFFFKEIAANGVARKVNKTESIIRCKK